MKKLPNLSYMMSVGELRYIQAHFEKGAAKGPDGLVGGFLPWPKRLGCWVRGTLLLPKLRANPFYAYLNARTKYYDQVFSGALERSITRIVNIGCGSDTRAQRFAGHQSALCLMGRRHRLVVADGEVAVETPVEALDALQIGPGQLDRGDRLRPDACCRFAGGE